MLGECLTGHVTRIQNRVPRVKWRIATIAGIRLGTIQTARRRAIVLSNRFMRM